jgi:hypothetical protein
VFRYYFNPPLRQAQIIDPMYFRYHNSAGENIFGEQAYRAAMSERAFTHVVLDGGMGEEAGRLDSAIRPMLPGYKLEMRAVDPVRGHDIEIYSRDDTAGAVASNPGSPSIQILSPETGATVSGATTLAQGRATGAQQGWYVRLEVFTNRWYPQGEAVPISGDGSFRQAIYLGGNGRQQCFHLVRATLVDDAGRSRAAALNYGIARGDRQGTCSLSASASSASDQRN